MVKLELEPYTAGELYYQIGARVQYFEDEIKKCGKQGNVERIMEISRIVTRLKDIMNQLLNNKETKYDR